MGYKRLRPRSWPLYQDEDQRREFRQRLCELLCREDLEIWYQDECGVMGDRSPRHVWAKRGSRPVLTFTGKHIKTNVIGAVRPIDGKFISLIMPKMNTDVFQIFLNELNHHITKGKRVIMILDNATWHKTKKLSWGRIEPEFLPPYSPDLNCIERIWLNLKESFFTSSIAESYDELEEQLMKALQFFHKNNTLCKSICGV